MKPVSFKEPTVKITRVFSPFLFAIYKNAN
jgi:hypothetical protein